MPIADCLIGECGLLIAGVGQRPLASETINNHAINN
jgi:hypothetical protein